MAEREVTPEQLADTIRGLKVSDLLISTCSTLAQVGYAKLEPATRDLEQARIAIEALRALVPVFEQSGADDVARDFRQVVANLQLAFTDAATKAGRAEQETEGDAAAPPPDADG